jgi:2-keto-3-deoxy-L-rhamnonate aldolase RhmA
MDYPTSLLRKRLTSNELALCMSTTLARTADTPMIAAAAGFDAIYIDLEHSATSLETTSTLCSAALLSGITPLVRVPSHDHQYMTRALDTGAMGIIVPHVNDVNTVVGIVDACKFPPMGHRSIVGTHPSTRYLPMLPAQLVEYLNRETFICVMVETPEAVDLADAFAAVPGVDMILVGPYDLSAELGILGQFRDPKFSKAMSVVAAACKRHNKVMGVAGIKDEALLAEYAALGVRFFSAGNDAGFLSEAAKAQATKMRSIAVP